MVLFLNHLFQIVGASRGVGRELALQLAALGAYIVCCDIDSAGNKKTYVDITQSGGHAIAYHVDVTDRDQVIETTLTLAITIFHNRVGNFYVSCKCEQQLFSL